MYAIFDHNNEPMGLIADDLVTVSTLLEYCPLGCYITTLMGVAFKELYEKEDEEPLDIEHFNKLF